MASPDAALLRSLRHSARPLLPSELAMASGLTPAEVHARLDDLAASGFALQRHPSLGCSLLASPDRLIADDLWSRLPTPSSDLIREIVVLAETGSTNDVAMRLGRKGVPGGVLVLAEKQTSGRGRFGRKWESAAGRGLWLSLLLQPTLPFMQWPRLTTWLAVSAAAAIEAISPVRCGLKWPNDLQVAGRKVAGMLLEIGTTEAHRPATSGAPAPFLVAGLGLNANHEAADFPEELRDLATSLRLSSGAPIDRTALAARLLEELERRWPKLADPGFAEILHEATARSTVLGRWIRVQVQGDTVEGEASGLDPEGHLLLRQADGRIRTLLAGEVTLRA